MRIIGVGDESSNRISKPILMIMRRVPQVLYDLFARRAKFCGNEQLLTRCDSHIAEAHVAKGKRHERELAAVDFLQMRFEHSASDARDRAFADAIETGDSRGQFFIEIELAGDAK